MASHIPVKPRRASRVFLLISLAAAALVAVAADRATAQGQIDPDLGYLILEAAANGDPTAAPTSWTFDVTNSCGADSVVGLGSGLSFEGGVNIISVPFSDLYAPDGSFCDYTITPQPAPGFSPYPASIDFQFGEPPYAEAGASFMFVGGDPVADLEVSMQAWDITQAQHASGSWPNPQTWVFASVPDSWPYVVTSSCLASPLEFELPVNTQAPSFRSSQTLQGLDLFDANGDLCTYLVNKVETPGWTVVIGNESQPVTLAPYFQGSAHTLSVKTTDTTAPEISIDGPGNYLDGDVTLEGTSEDNVDIDRNKLFVRNQGTGQFWNGTSWVNTWSWFTPNGLEDWNYSINLVPGTYRLYAWTWDTTNLVATNSKTITVGPDTEDPTVSFIGPTSTSDVSTGDVFIYGKSEDNVEIDHNKFLIRREATGEYWNGTEWTPSWSWITPGSGTTEDWFQVMSLVEPGRYRLYAWTWDTSDNVSTASETILVGGDNSPTVRFLGPTSTSNVSTGDVFFYGRSEDDFGIDRNKFLIRNLETGNYWNGTEWTSSWSWITPGSGTTEDWYQVMLLVDAGQYRIYAWTWDTSNNMSIATELITVTF